MALTHDRVRAILSEAETAIKALIAEELDEGCYDQVAMLAQIGDTLSELAGTIAGSPSHKANVIANRKAGATPAPVGRSSLHAKFRQPTRATQYPQFVRNGNKLVKIGWSRKSRKEYEHRAPREVVQAFAQSLWGRIEPGRVFAMEEILPVHDSSGDELPDYQSYLALVWLRREGTIEKVGRNGYVLAIQNMDTGTFDALWNRLPEQP